MFLSMPDVLYLLYFCLIRFPNIILHQYPYKKSHALPSPMKEITLSGPHCKDLRHKTRKLHASGDITGELFFTRIQRH